MNVAAFTISILLASQVTVDPPATSSGVLPAGGIATSTREFKSIVKASAEVPAASPAAQQDSALVPVRSPLERGAAPEMLQTALTPPTDGALTGRPYSLLEVLSRNVDRNQQLLTTKAYWKLSIATAEYHFAIEEERRLEKLADESTLGSSILQAAKAAAAASVREAELAALTAQSELAELVFLPPSDPPPLTADVPHVGSYRTYFETLFAQRIPPGRARLIDRSLPIRREAIELRAAAAQSALEAADAAPAALASGQVTINQVLSAHDAVKLQRRAFLAAVWEYNNDIADYAMTVAQVGTTEAVLVSMLIKTPTQSQPSDRREPTPASPDENGNDAGLNWRPRPGSDRPAAGTGGQTISPFDPAVTPDRSVVRPSTPEEVPAPAVQPLQGRLTESQQGQAQPAQGQFTP